MRILLFALVLSGCATQSDRSELSGNPKKKIEPTFTCEFKVLYQKDAKKVKVAKNMRPYYFNNEWMFFKSANKYTKVTAKRCKSLAKTIHSNFRLENGVDDQGFPKYLKPVVLATYWTVNDASAMLGRSDSHGIVCSEKTANTDTKNKVFEYLDYSCGHEYFFKK